MSSRTLVSSCAPGVATVLRQHASIWKQLCGSGDVAGLWKNKMGRAKTNTVYVFPTRVNQPVTQPGIPNACNDMNTWGADKLFDMNNDFDGMATDPVTNKVLQRPAGHSARGGLHRAPMACLLYHRRAMPRT